MHRRTQHQAPHAVRAAGEALHAHAPVAEAEAAPQMDDSGDSEAPRAPQLDGMLKDLLDEAAAQAAAEGHPAPGFIHIAYAFTRLISAAHNLDDAGVPTSQLRRVLRRLQRHGGFAAAGLLRPHDEEQRAIAKLFSAASDNPANAGLITLADLAGAIQRAQFSHPVVALLDDVKSGEKTIAPNASPQPPQRPQSVFSAEALAEDEVGRAQTFFAEDHPGEGRGSQVSRFAPRDILDAGMSAGLEASPPPIRGDEFEPQAAYYAAPFPREGEMAPAAFAHPPSHDTSAERQQVHACKDGPRIAEVLEALAQQVKALGETQQKHASANAGAELEARMARVEAMLEQLVAATNALTQAVNTTRQQSAAAHTHAMSGAQKVQPRATRSLAERSETRLRPSGFRLGVSGSRKSVQWRSHSTRTGRTARNDAPAAERVPRLGRDARDNHVPQEPRYYLSIDDDIVAAPSIGPRTAERLRRAGIETVRALLDADPDEIANEIGSSYITGDAIADWQDQAGLMLIVPELRITHAQLLVGAGYRSARSIQRSDAADVQSAVLRFAASREGQRVLRDGPPPAAERVRSWIAHAEEADESRAA